MLIEIYGNDNLNITGPPEIRHISTSHTERQNLSMRMGMCRFTRLTNAFPKKLENHEHAVALCFMFYNFARIHQTLRVTPLWKREFPIMFGVLRKSFPFWTKNEEREQLLRIAPITFR